MFANPLTVINPFVPLQVVGLVPTAFAMPGVWLTVTETVAAEEVQLLTTCTTEYTPDIAVVAFTLLTVQPVLKQLSKKLAGPVHLNFAVAFPDADKFNV